jgi:predicted acyltransferase (DUF342 family)
MADQYNKILTTVNSVTSNYSFTPDLSNVIVIDTSNNRIGINTVNPKYSIDVSGGLSDISGTIRCGEIIIGTADIKELFVSSNTLYVGGIPALSRNINNELVIGDSNNSSILNNVGINLMSVTNLNVNGDASINNVLEVSNNLIVLGDTSINNVLEVSNNLYVLGDASINNVLEVSNNLYVLGDASINNVLEVSNNLIVLGDASINNNLEVSNKLLVLGDASINNVLEVSNKLLVLGDASINNVLEVSNNLLVLGDASINNVLEVSNKLLVLGDASINNNLEVSNDLLVLGDASINNVLEVSNNLLVLGDASINNNLEVSNDLLVLGDASINNVSCGNLTIDNINIDGNRITNDITLVGTTTETLYKIVATTLNNQNSGQSKQIVHDIRSNFDGTDDLRYRICRTGKLGDSDEFHVDGFDTIRLYGSTDTTDNNWGRGLQVYAKARFHNGTNGTSDDRLKFNERSINNSLNIIRQLNPLIYERSDNFNDASNLLYTEAGLIAQSVLEISDLSYCVIGGDYYDISNNLIQNAYALDYNSLFIYNIAATKELDSIVQVQESEIVSLKNKNTILENEIITIKASLNLLLTQANLTNI